MVRVNYSLFMNSFTVVYFYPRPRKVLNFSLEFLFNKIQDSLPQYIKTKTAISTFHSRGVWRRLYNIIEASFRQSDINHIIGDVHFLALLLKKRKTILTIHDCIFMQHPSVIKRMIYRWFWLVLPIYRCRVITVVSQATKSEVLKYVHCQPDKIHVIPNFISDKYKPCFKPFNVKKPVILHIGTAVNKNLERLIEALHGITCHLCIIGKLSPHYLMLLEQFNIDFSNFFNVKEDEIVHHYEQCDLLAFISTYEGFGLPILEAQSIGRPVITSCISSMPEVAGSAACFVNPFDVADIKRGIIRIIKDDSYRNELINNGWENIKRYSLASTKEQYIHLYQEIVANYGSGVGK